MRFPRALAAAPIAAAVVLGGCGSGGTVGSGHDAGGHSPAAPAGTGTSAAPAPTDPAARVIEVEMIDNAFRPDQVQVRPGETVTFRFTNTGAARHEAVIGDDAAQAGHHGDDMAHHDGAVPAVTLEPGASAELPYTAGDRRGIVIGCHEPGHWDAGMKAVIVSG